MKISRSDAKRLGITGGTGPRKDHTTTGTPQDGNVDRGRARSGARMNKLEARFAEQLEAWRMCEEIEWWQFEPVKLQLAMGAGYRPDFMTFGGGFPYMSDPWDPRRQVVFFEVKGFMRESANVRIKVAARTYPFWRFVLVRWNRKEWQFTEIKR
jgi:hypothetical protein